MRWTASAALALCVALAIPAGAQEIDSGRALFLGRATQTDDPALARRLARLPCKSCHGADGQGADEGRAPPIDGPSLSRATPDRPAYDAALFHRAVTAGQSSGGRALSQLMPRYPMNAPEATALFAYLAVLPAEQRRGVTSARVTFGVATPPGSGYRQTLQAALEARLGGAMIHGRTVALMPVDPGNAATARQVFAVLAPPTEVVPDLEAEGIPVLFPIGSLSGDEDPGTVRGFLSSAAGTRATLAARLTSEARGPIAIWPEGMAEGLRAALSASGPPAPSTKHPASEIVVLDGADLDTALKSAPGARLWIGWEAIRQAGHLPADREVIAINDVPALIEPGGESPLAAHARLSGAVLAEVLKAAGRDLTRARLMAAFSAAWLDGLDLDYTAHPLTGTARVEFLPLR